VVKHLTEKGIEAKNVHIELELAKEWGANVLLPARGTIGNQIFRAMYYLGRGKVILCPTILTKEHIYEDDSRNERDFYTHLIFAQALANEKLLKS
jgi:predicted methyltransferase MtxX (methanogen marker protein 4)